MARVTEAAASTRRFPKSQRLLTRPEIDRVTDRGRRKVSRHFVVLARENDTETARLGLIVSRRTGNAVARNRVKRRIREWFRHAVTGLPAWDLVIIARRGAPRLETDQVARELERAVTGLGSRGRKE